MTPYQVISRKFRPHTFSDVLGQEAIVQTLKNALELNQIAHAYLFCGSRGTGKTTLARIYAKALNCNNLTDSFEPCCLCTSCKEIAQGISLDVLEIDGASNRGIDDIRQINDASGYAPSQGRYRINIIDEVHMLTKEAFNALLKILEEPPPQVKFFFATTEPHKIPQTILSRCQRFNLKRISLETIERKLSHIAQQLHITTDQGTLRKIAQYAEGGLRDAESLFDQLIAFSNGKLTYASVEELLGNVSKDWFHSFDTAFHQHNLASAFHLATEVFTSGKDILHFLEDLLDHYRKILHIHLGSELEILSLDPVLKEHYKQASTIYSQEQALTILEYILETQQTIKSALSQQVVLECLLLKILRLPLRIPIEVLVKRLNQLESLLSHVKDAPPLLIPCEETKVGDTLLNKNRISSQQSAPSLLNPIPLSTAQKNSSSIISQQTPLQNQPRATPLKTTQSPSLPNLEKPDVARESTATSLTQTISPISKEEIKSSSPQDNMQRKNRYDTLLQFAAVELDGIIQKKQTPRS